MARQYSDDSYGSRKNVSLVSGGSVDGTYQSAVDILRHTFMFPAKVVDWNVAIGLVGGTDLGADVYGYLGKSLGGTGAVSVIGTWDTLQGTGTYAAASVSDCAVDAETSFTAGDDLVFQLIGTVGHAINLAVNAEVIEVFEQADS
jgi:hypothetical protein